MAGDARFDISDSGTLAYSGVDPRRRSLVVVDFFGRVISTEPGERNYASFNLSPDGRRVAGQVDGEVLIVDLDRLDGHAAAPELKSGRDRQRHLDT